MDEIPLLTKLNHTDYSVLATSVDPVPTSALPSVKSTTSSSDAAAYVFILPNNYPQNTEFLNLEPVVHHILSEQQQEKIIINFHTYIWSNASVVFRCDGIAIGPLDCDVESDIHKPNICMDWATKTLKTTSEQLDIDTTYCTKIKIELFDPEGSTVHPIYIDVRKERKCDAQTSIINKVNECEPSWQSVGRIEEKTSPSSIFILDRNFVGKPTMLSGIKINESSFDSQSNEFNMTIVETDTNKSVFTKRILIRNISIVNFNVVLPNAKQRYSVSLSNSIDEKVIIPLELFFHDFRKFCSQSFKCYDLMKLWGFMKSDGICKSVTIGNDKFKFTHNDYNLCQGKKSNEYKHENCSWVIKRS